MTTMNVLDSAGGVVAIEKPLTPGRSAAATSRPVALSTEDKTALDAVATQVTAAAILAKIIAAPATEAKQDTGNTSLASIASLLTTQAGYLDGIEALIGTTNGKDFATQTTLAAVLAKLNASIAATQSGTWTVQPGNTANTTAWKVDGSAVTQPASIADGSHATFGAKADAKSIATDATAVSAMSVWKQISASVQAIATSIAGTITTNLSAATNASTTAYATNLVIKASAGTLYGLSGYNSKATGQFIQLHDAASLPADTAVPKIVIYVQPSSPFSIDFGARGRAFGAGMVICNSSTGPTKTVGSADIWVDAQYA